MPNFDGVLKSNEIYAGLFNMIISQQVFSDNISGLSSSLVDKARVDGSLYGDTKLYYSSDVLESEPWVQDSAKATNLLEIKRAPDPEIQAIRLDIFRQVFVTVDNYLSKRAWGTEGAFQEFNSVILAWVRDTKKIYDVTTYNTYIGTAETDVGEQIVTIDLTGLGTGEEANRMEAMTIGQKLADLFVDLKDVSRDYNDYGNMRAFDPADLEVVWNSSYVNKIRHVDLPTIFHDSGIIEKFDQEMLNSKYFGKVNVAGGTAPTDNKTVRAMVEKTFGDKHIFPGELLPDGAEYLAGETFTEDDTVICKIMHKNSVPYMSAFEVATSFYNSRNLSENQYLTWGHNTLEYLKNYPFITVKAVK